jgi:hypothetical protein
LLGSEKSSNFQASFRTFDPPNRTNCDLRKFGFFGVECCLLRRHTSFIFVRVEELLDEMGLVFVFDAVLSLGIFDLRFRIHGRRFRKIRAKLRSGFLFVTEASNLG